VSADRELLELAGKAFDLSEYHTWDGYGLREQRVHGVPHCGHHGPVWNPLEDDGDAFRLAAKLQLRITHRTLNVDVSRGNVSASEYVPTYVDIYKATRRAIVRTAAHLAELQQ
jgi:hypothetical protein